MRRGIFILRRIESLVLTVVLSIVSLVAFLVPFSVEGTGDLGNEPDTGYSEGDEIFAITTDDLLIGATTSFDPGENFQVTLTSYLVDLLGNGQNENTVYIADYLGNLQGPSTGFSQLNGVGGEHVYTQTLQAPSTPDHYLVVARIADNSGNEFFAKDVIIVGGGASPQKYIKTYSDAAYSTVDWTFTSIDTIYIEVYSSETGSYARSSVSFADYSGGESTKAIRDLDKDTVTMSGNYARIEYDLTKDLDVGDLTGGALNDGYWYTLTVDFEKGNGDPVTKDWSIQIQITDVVEPSLSVQNDAIQAVPNTVEREGTYVTTISTQFEDTDEPNADSFIVTFKVRDRNGDEITIMDGKQNGQSGEFGGTLIMTSSGGGVYTASYDLDPDNSFITGDYDLYFKVEDGTGETAEDGYQPNRDELQITSSTSPPQVNNDATQCIPNIVDKIGEHVTTISTQFFDPDSLSVNDFTVLFKIRAPDDSEIILVNNKADGQTGELGGTLTITSSAEGVYTASYTFDPDGSFQTGDYDLYFKVTDQHGNSDTDGYIPNRDELHITSSAAEPTVDTGATQFIPNAVAKGGDSVTTISAQFEDIDSDSVSDFTVTFKVRYEDGTEYVLVDSAKNGDAGEYGGKLSITTSSPGVYVASYVWNPPSSMPNGNYSLYFKVEDEYGSFAEDGYANNMDELMVTGEGKEEPESIPFYVCLIPVVIILIIFLILLIAARKRKKEETSPYPPPQAPGEGEEMPLPPSGDEKLPPPTSDEGFTPPL